MDDTTPTLKLLKLPQPANLEISQLRADLNAPAIDDMRMDVDLPEPTVPPPLPSTTDATVQGSPPPRPASGAPVEGRNSTTTDTTIAPHSAVSSAGGIFTDKDGYRWITTTAPTNVRQLARRFKVDAASYWHWMREFKQFGPGGDP